MEIDSPRVEAAAAESDGPAALETPEQILLRATVREDLQAALDALPEVFREAVWLRDVEEFTYAEIAGDARHPDWNGDVEDFAGPPPSVRTAQHRAGSRRRRGASYTMTTMDDCRRTAATSHARTSTTRCRQESGPTSSGTSARCPPCRAAALQESGARTRAARTGARADRRRRCRPAFAAAARRSPASTRRHPCAATRRFALRRFAPLTAVVTVVIGFFLFSLATHRSDTVLAAQLTADHAKCFRLFAQSDSPDDDAHRVEQMLDRRLWLGSARAAFVAADGVHLIGARRCLYADGPVPHVMYRVNGHDVSLYVLDGVTRSGSRSGLVRPSFPHLDRRPQDLRAGVACGGG